MEHKKIFTLFITMIIIVISAFVLFENSPAIARALGVNSKLVDCSALALLLSGMFPSVALNETIKEGRR